MKTIIVDDEILDIKLFTEGETGSLEIVKAFQNPVDVFEYIEQNEVELVILDIEMPEMNGFEVGKRLRILRPDMIVVYATGFARWAFSVIDIKEYPLVMKPYNIEEIESIVAGIKLEMQEKTKEIQARMFGKFELYAGGISVSFKHADAKELLALCIDKCGAWISVEDVARILWKKAEMSEVYQMKYRQAAEMLQNSLEEAGISDLFYYTDEQCHINAENLNCDLYRYRSSQRTVEFDFWEDYLPEYEWAEETQLEMIKAQIYEENNV